MDTGVEGIVTGSIIPMKKTFDQAVKFTVVELEIVKRLDVADDFQNSTDNAVTMGELPA